MGKIEFSGVGLSTAFYCLAHFGRIMASFHVSVRLCLFSSPQSDCYLKLTVLIALGNIASFLKVTEHFSTKQNEFEMFPLGGSFKKVVGGL